MMKNNSNRGKFANWYFKAHICPAAAMVIVAAAALVAYVAVTASPAAVRFCIDHISRPLREILGTINSFIPLSVMELMYAAAALWLVLHILRTVLILCACHSAALRFKSLALRLLLLVAVVLMFVSGYCWLWGMDYNGDSFSVRSGIDARPVTAQEVYQVASLFLYNANRLSVQMPRDESGAFAVAYEDILSGCTHAYDNAQEVFPLLTGRSRMPKPMVASELMSWLGFTGVYFPFTGESNINVDMPTSLMAMTVCHELAHQRGVYAEDECNFLGVFACITCDDPVYQYSGYFGGLIYLMNELYKLDKDAWMELRGGFTPQLEADWAENNAYWRSYQGAAEEIAGEIYDSYLKANGQELGLLSYDACVKLLVAYFK